MIDVTREGGLWQVTLNRPQKANSLTAQMLEDLLRTVTDADGVAKVLVLTGTGSVFSAGADLDEARAGLATSDVWEILSAAISVLPCLTIAALNGTMAGGAFGMALACDLRIAVPEANFFYPVMKLGFLPQPSDPVRLTALIGPARAKMILLAGQKISANEALNWGLVDRLVPKPDLPATIAALSADALQADAGHVEAIKNMVEARACD